MNRVERRSVIRQGSILRRRDGTRATKSPIVLRVAHRRARNKIATVSRRAGR